MFTLASDVLGEDKNPRGGREESVREWSTPGGTWRKLSVQRLVCGADRLYGGFPEVEGLHVNIVYVTASRGVLSFFAFVLDPLCHVPDETPTPELPCREGARCRE